MGPAFSLCVPCLPRVLISSAPKNFLPFFLEGMFGCGSLQLLLSAAIEASLVMNGLGTNLEV